MGIPNNQGVSHQFGPTRGLIDAARQIQITDAEATPRSSSQNSIGRGTSRRKVTSQPHWTGRTGVFVCVAVIALLATMLALRAVQTAAPYSSYIPSVRGRYTQLPEPSPLI